MSLLRFILFMALSACYVPAGPEIYHVHVSCHWNPGYDDNMWIFQVWVDHPVHASEVTDVNAYIYGGPGNTSTLSMEYSNGTLWKNVLRESETDLVCGEWYQFDMVAVDKYDYADHVRVYYY
tara:strand:+ start:289 stop:654 length:366 start_codon:yes stop_codon:yes gene_type:complete